MAKAQKISQKTQGNTDGQRIGIFGASGSGKTTKARELIKNCGRLIVFDPKQEWLREGRGWLKSPVIVSNLFEFKKAMQKKFSQPTFAIVYVPPLADASAHLSALCNEIFKMQVGYKALHCAKITLLVDEAQEGIPSGTSRLNPYHGALTIAKMGRDRGINLIVASQRIKTVDIGIRANLSAYFIFRLAELTDIKEANQFIMDLQGLMKQENFSYYFKGLDGKVQFFEKK